MKYIINLIRPIYFIFFNVVTKKNLTYVAFICGSHYISLESQIKVDL